MREEQAFPRRSGHPDFDFKGMSLRDWFAGQALAALGGYVVQPDGGTGDVLARICYDTADAMLRAREGERDA